MVSGEGLKPYLTPSTSVHKGFACSTPSAIRSRARWQSPLSNNSSSGITPAARIRAAGVMPELELFDSGDCHLARDLIAEGVLQAKPLCTLVLGVKYGFNPSPETMLYARGLLPEDATWTGFGIGRSEFPLVAQAWLLGGHARVGMEDNLYMSKGVLAKTNAELVTHAVDILKGLGAAIASPAEAR